MTTNNIPVKMQHDIIDYANASVKAIAMDKYKGLFSKEDLEDISGNTIFKACHSIGHYNSQWALSTWVGKIARNCIITALDYKMKRKPISEAMYVDNGEGEEVSRMMFGSYRGDEYNADRDIELSEFIDDVNGVRDTLSDKNKEFFDMLADRCAPREMAAITGCTPDAAAIRAHHIRKQLREPMKEIADKYGITCKKLCS